MSSTSGDRSILTSARGVLLDLDGTVYLGEHLLPGALEFMNRLRTTRRTWLFITNNCSKDPIEYSSKLTKLGINTPQELVYTSGELAAHYLLAKGITRAYVLGTPSLVRQLKSFGIEHDDASPQAVLSSFDLTLTYDRLLSAVRFVQAGMPLYSTHPDLVCPTPDGPIPDSGLITGVVEKTTGVKAKYLGKPMVEMVAGAAERMALEPSQLVFIGDRLYTDMKMAIEAGIGSILVLSGETTQAMLSESDLKPGLVAGGLCDLIELL